MAALILAESAMFTIFVVAYLYYLGRSATGPQPRDVLDLPLVGTACLLGSSATVALAVRALERGRAAAFTAWWGATVALAAAFLAGTAREWHRLIVTDGLSIQTNLFGTTFYALVGLHAAHVVVGVTALAVVLACTLAGRVHRADAPRVDVLALYWHFVDAVWVVVLTVVYVVGR
jgi:cytochrome c oxidase subunit 3/cytochrome o ubiquinol oxidase subunit 3